MFASPARCPVGPSNATVTVNCGSSAVQRFRNFRVRRLASPNERRGRAGPPAGLGAAVCNGNPPCRECRDHRAGRATTLDSAMTPLPKSLNQTAAPSNPTATPDNAGIQCDPIAGPALPEGIAGPRRQRWSRGSRARTNPRSLRHPTRAMGRGSACCETRKPPRPRPPPTARS